MTNVHQLPLAANAVLPPIEDRDWVTSSELITRTGISYRQLDYWTRTGLLTPLDAAHPGSGYLRRYDQHQVTRARALHDLLAGGITLPACREAIDQIVEHGQATLGHLTITHNPTGERTA